MPWRGQRVQRAVGAPRPEGLAGLQDDDLCTSPHQLMRDRDADSSCPDRDDRVGDAELAIAAW
jgi:hypothetical protein